jgi:NAD(P)-dependent dehydrogenase (short-subunit alcohol dehydrogenase family)
VAVRQSRRPVHAETEERKDYQHFVERCIDGNPNYIHYVTSKGALIAMTRAMARELGDYNICVNTVSPRCHGRATS